MAGLTEKLVCFKHRARLTLLAWRRRTSYRNYLETQLARTLAVRHRAPPLRAEILIDNMLQRYRPPVDARILCIGCRGTGEIDYFKRKGFAHTVGIDLFSERSDIRVMDMHHMSFEDDSFQVVLSSHSLEHSCDVQTAAREIIRVASPGAVLALEVPVHYKISVADLIDFESLENLHTLFNPYIDEILWCDEQPPNCRDNQHGTAVLRSVFSIKKNKAP